MTTKRAAADPGPCPNMDHRVSRLFPDVLRPAPARCERKKQPARSEPLALRRAGLPVICPQIPSLMGGGIWGQITGGLPGANPVRVGTVRSDQTNLPQGRRQRQTGPYRGASDETLVRHCGTRSNRQGWAGMVWKGQRALPCRGGTQRGGWPSAGALPQRDRTQISEPQVESLHKCALVLYRPTGKR